MENTKYYFANLCSMCKKGMSNCDAKHVIFGSEVKDTAKKTIAFADNKFADAVVACDAVDPKN